MNTTHETEKLRLHVSQSIHHLGNTDLLKELVNVEQHISSIEFSSFSDIHYYQSIAQTLELHVKTVVELKSILTKAVEPKDARKVA